MISVYQVVYHCICILLETETGSWDLGFFFNLVILMFFLTSFVPL